MRHFPPSLTMPSVLSREVVADPAHLRAWFADPTAHLAAQRFRWFSAMLDPNSTFGGPRTGAPAAQKYIRTEKPTDPYVAIIQPAAIARKHTAGIGKIEDGDVMIVTLPDQVALSDHDWVIPIGRDEGYPTGATIAANQLVVRGSKKVLMTGTISNSGVTVTGVGTLFTKELGPGTLISVGNVAVPVKSILSDTALTLQSAPINGPDPNPAFTGNKFYRGQDMINFYPAAIIDEVIDSSGKTYTPGVDVVLSNSGRWIHWLSGPSQPAPGATYSVSYRYYPTYEVRDLISPRQRPVGGLEFPQGFLCRLVKPETQEQ